VRWQDELDREVELVDDGDAFEGVEAEPDASAFESATSVSVANWPTLELTWSYVAAISSETASGCFTDESACVTTCPSDR
jgi:hypothetical protein